MREGTAELAAARHSAAEEQRQSSKAVQAQQAATEAAQQQLQVAQVSFAVPAGWLHSCLQRNNSVRLNAGDALLSCTYLSQQGLLTSPEAKMML